MDPDTIKKIAEEIVNQSPLGNYAYCAIVIILSIVASSIVSFLVSYFNEKGKITASNVAFKKIIRRQKETTKVTEEIRATINNELVNKREHAILLREKGEQLIEKSFDLETWLGKARDQVLDGKILDSNESPLSKISVFQTVYFENLADQLHKVRKAFIAEMQWVIMKSKESNHAKNQKRQPDFSMGAIIKLAAASREALESLRIACIDDMKRRGALGENGLNLHPKDLDGAETKDA